MAGLAATLDVPEAVEALAAALGTRGADGALCRLNGWHGARLDVCVRAVMPSVARVVGAGPAGLARPPAAATPAGAAASDEEATGTVIAAFAVDGVASVTALDGGYATLGPAGLLVGAEPYAVILADAEREELVLARNGDGPGLYYARLRAGWVVASEPTALLAAGVPAFADGETVRRYVVNGSCDDSARSFFAGIARVRPGEAVVLSRSGEVSSEYTEAPEAVPAPVTADGDGRVGVLLTPGMAGAAVLGAALLRDDRPQPLAVHTVRFPMLESPASHQPAVLVPLPHGMVRHVEHGLDAANLALEAFLLDVGEPVPDLGLFSAWAVARDLDGGVDTLLDSSRGRRAGVARLSDRVQARYGVSVRAPLREADVDGLVGDAQLMSVASRGLLPPVVRYAAQDSAEPVQTAEVLVAMLDQVAAALSTPRPWADRDGVLAELRRLAVGEPVHAEALFRLYLVERWLATFAVDPIAPPGLTPTPSGRTRAVQRPVAARIVPSQPIAAQAVPAQPVPPPATARPTTALRGPAGIELGDTTWHRVPVRTEVFEPGDLIALEAAGYASRAIANLVGNRAYADVLNGPWFVVLSAKPLAVCQRRATPLSQIKPGLVARLLSWLAGASQGPGHFGPAHLGQPRTMQVALEEAGAWRLAAATFAAALRCRGLALRLLPDAAATVSAPRRDAVPPANDAVVRPPFLADEAAIALRDGLRQALTPAALAMLAGCAIVAADETGSQVMGFAPGPRAEAVPAIANVVAELCADNPAGQSGQRTPVVLLLPAPTQRMRQRAARQPGAGRAQPVAVGGAQPTAADGIAAVDIKVPRDGYRSAERSAASFSSAMTRRPS